MGRVFDVGLPTWIGEHFLNTGYPTPHSESPFYNQFLSQPSWMSQNNLNFHSFDNI